MPGSYQIRTGPVAIQHNVRVIQTHQRPRDLASGCQNRIRILKKQMIAPMISFVDPLSTRKISFKAFVTLVLLDRILSNEPRHFPSLWHQRPLVGCGKSHVHTLNISARRKQRW